MATAREHAGIAVKEARVQLANDVEVAKTSLAASSQALADQITGAILHGRPV